MKKHFAIIAVAAIFAVGCSTEYKNDSTDYASTEAVADSGSVIDFGEKIIQTADMRFRVNNVQQTKETLSKAIKSKGGLLMEASISSTVQKSEKVKYSADSLKEITAYRKDAYVVAKIPSDKLDEFTNEIAGLAVFVDQQSLKMEDASLQYLENRLKSENRKEAVDQLNKVATKKGTNVENALNMKDDLVDRKIQNINIDNSVKYSTITLSFYQDNTIKTLIVANDNIYDYKPNFFRRLGLNLNDGWMYFKEFILFISSLWLFIVVGGLVFSAVRYYIKKQDNKTLLPPSK
jgi:hypothetical protein